MSAGCRSAPRPYRIRAAPRAARARPGLPAPPPRLERVARLALRVEALREAKERPSILAEALQIFVIHPFGFGGPSRVEQDRAEHLARRVMPQRRFAVREAILDG